VRVSLKARLAGSIRAHRIRLLREEEYACRPSTTGQGFSTGEVEKIINQCACHGHIGVYGLSSARRLIDQMTNAEVKRRCARRAPVLRAPNESQRSGSSLR
jgi:hypothetical protein